MTDTITTPAARIGARLPALLLAGVLLMAGAGAAFGQDAAPGSGVGGPDTPVSSDSMTEPRLDDGATLAEPDPTIVDALQTGWHHVTVSADGRTLTVYFWNGVDACFGLARVDVILADGGVDIAPWVGTRPEAVGQACILVAQLYKTIVVLEEPIITGGAI